MIKIVSPKTREEFKAYYDLRYKVLREPWGLQKGTEKDDFEPISRHYMAVDDSTNQIVGVVKLMEKEPGGGGFLTWQAEKYQNTGVGKQLLNYVEGEAKKEGYNILGCMSRLNSTDYFGRAGFQINGLPSHYIGTTQVVWMEKKIN
jgi:GNAT superfamily N-acetyltransferase